MNPILNANRVNKLFLSCLYAQPSNSNKPPEGAVIVKGITFTVCFDPVKLAAVEDEIGECLDQLPATFHSHGGGGWSFLNMCVDKNDHQWGEHKDMQELLMMGIAIKRAAYCLRRDMWDALPGQMPYFVIYPKGELPASSVLAAD